MNIITWLDNRKTYVVAAAVVVSGVYGWFMGDYSAQEAVNYIFAGLGLGALRHGVSKATPVITMKKTRKPRTKKIKVENA